MKSVLLSIQSKWCELIASGEKTVEIRKTKPKIQTPFKCYIYCSKGKRRLLDIMKDGDENFGEIYHGKPVFITTPESCYAIGNGYEQKVIGEFICDEIKWHGESAFIVKEDCIKALEGSCLTEKEFHNYMNYPPINPYQDLREAIKKCQFYGWHISDLVIYDKPKGLGNFHHCGDNYHFNPPVMKPPQSWCYVEKESD